ncbi:hypothetical protein AGMMS50276_24840 [Synergistales bacterium]|nr:hypothetical protein AGMMS50276_24840 [Synergistales bacterium]
MNSKKTGIFVCFALAAIATYLGGLQHFMGGPIIGLLIGMLIMNSASVGPEFLKGAKFASKTILSAAIVLVGGTLDIHKIMGTGGAALPMLIVNICIAIGAAAYVGKRMKLSSDTALLIGSGTAICGGTAIATAASIIHAREEDIAYAMTAIFFFDILGALAYPYIAVGVGMTNAQMSFLIGGTVNDLSSVTAAEATFNALTAQNLSMALTVKLARTTLLIPLSMVLSVLVMRKAAVTEKSGASVMPTLRKSIPWVMVYFVIMATLNSAGMFEWLSVAVTGAPGNLGRNLSVICKFLTTVALCGVGFKIKFRDLLTNGLKPVILGGVAWLSITLFTLFYIGHL